MRAPRVKILFKVLLLTTNTSTLYSRLLPASTFTSSSPSSHLPALPDHSFVSLSLCSHSLFFLHSPFHLGGYLNILNHQHLAHHAIATRPPRASMMHVKLPLRSTTRPMSGSKIMQA